jgi:hypothetical protein
MGFPEPPELFASWAAKGRALEVIHEEFEVEWGRPEEMGLPWDDSDSDSDCDGSDTDSGSGSDDDGSGMIEIELEDDNLIEIDISKCR